MEQPGRSALANLANAVIVGVEKAGTTSLFRSLSGHPQVAPASVKETRYFQPILSGDELEPIEVYAGYFEGAADEPVRLEATPRYFYGGAPLARAMCAALGSFRAIVVLREPVDRFVSFFEFQQARLRIPAEMTVPEYLERADAMTDADFRDPANHPWFGIRGGRYADWLPAWRDALGADLEIVMFEDLVADTASTLRSVAAFLGIDPEAYPDYELASENRTTAYRRAGLQRLALAVNDRFERFFRRHYGLKERLRGVYYRLNGSAARRATVSPRLRKQLIERFAEPNARLAAELETMGIDVPRWAAVAEPARA
jgi:Sulfotransferase domain